MSEHGSKSRWLRYAVKTPEDLYGAMLELYPRRSNPGSLWGGAKHAKSASPVG
jgi:hypothetical protein